MNYYERHIGDYLKDTAHLSLLEHGVYGRLLDVYYTRECPISDTEAARLIGARSRDEKAALRAVLTEFFHMEVGSLDWSHKRCDAEVARYREKSQKARESVSKRWAKRDANEVQTHNERNTNVDTNVLPTHNEGNTPRARPQTPVTSNQKEENPPASRVPPTKGSRLPADWQPGDTGLAFAEQQGLRNGKASQEVAKFRDYWAAQPGQKGVKADWQATWRNWVRKATENVGGKPIGDDIFGGAK